MKNVLINSLLIVSIIFITGCTNKKEPIISSTSESKSSIKFQRVVDVDCVDGYTVDNIYSKLNDFDPQYSRNDNYTAEVRMCLLNKKQIKLDLIETITINNKDFNSTDQKYMNIFPCGEEKKINFRNGFLSICKGDDGFVHFAIESISKNKN